MRQLLVLIGIGLVSTSVAVDPPKEDAAAAGLKKLEGTWIVTRTEQGGRVLEKDEAGSNLVTFTGTKCTIISNLGGGQKLTLENTITLDPSRDPKWMDVTAVKPKQTWKGIYELKGDTLKAVFQGNKDGPRPTEFRTRPGSAEVMYTYRRVRK